MFMRAPRENYIGNFRDFRFSSRADSDIDEVCASNAPRRRRTLDVLSAALPAFRLSPRETKDSESESELEREGGRKGGRARIT